MESIGWVWFVGEMAGSFICVFLVFCAQDQSHGYCKIIRFVEVDNKKVSKAPTKKLPYAAEWSPQMHMG